MNVAVEGARPILEGDPSCEGSLTIILIVDDGNPRVLSEFVRVLFL